MEHRLADAFTLVYLAVLEHPNSKVHAALNQIEQALRAGQEMRSGLIWLGDDEDSLDTPEVDNPIKLALAMEAWDAAVGEKE